MNSILRGRNGYWKRNETMLEGKYMEYALRVCKKRDFRDLKEIYQECVEFHQKNGYSLKKLPDAPEIFLQYVGELMESEDAVVLVAAGDKGVMGYCISKVGEKPPVYADVNYGLIDSLAVAEEYQRKGVGEQLFLESVKWFKKKGLSRIELEVAVFNPKSVKFWKKMGFETFMNLMEWEM
jgi:ribosomal protein S18 acetylase RimI-like enzyme